MFLIDSHCHLDQLNYCDLHRNVSDVLDKAKTCHVKLVLSVSVSLENFSKLVNVIGYRDNVLFSCGVHPCYLNSSYDVSNLFALSNKKNVIAIGETGLDYCYSDNKKEQRQVFQDHLDVACQYKKPVIIHSRSASCDTLAILREMQCMFSGVLHCFTGDREMARELLNIGLYISFSGILTFQKSYNLRDVVSYIPLNRILLETDAPYLTPVPYRGIENQPAYVYNIAQCLAAIKNVTLEEVAHITTDNFFRLFHLDKDFTRFVEKCD